MLHPKELRLTSRKCNQGNNLFILTKINGFHCDFSELKSEKTTTTAAAAAAATKKKWKKRNAAMELVMNKQSNALFMDL